ncbi:MAG: hypothetical protein K6C14_01385 [Eubacterium sp.]|nr:hypothetical protein [Eubacterium sp.]
MENAVKAKKKLSAKRIVLILLAVVLLCDAVSTFWYSNPENIKQYEHTNRYIETDGKPYISAHRSGGGIAPEESMLAFKNCIENDDFNIDVFEFDLHITKDDVLILLHDDTLDRTTDSREVFGIKKARPENYTYEELRKLNIGANFKNIDGEKPYADLKGDDVPDDLRILRVEDVLDYIMANGDYDYIIEIKNGGELGKKGVDILVGILKERNLLDKVIFGTFKEEVSLYVDEHHPELKRSATIKEVITFFNASLFNKKNFEPKYIALQVPYNLYLRFLVNLGTARVINYAHSHNIAVQYWTVNSERQLKYLSSVGADCIMSDYPDRLYRVLHENE